MVVVTVTGHGSSQRGQFVCGKTLEWVQLRVVEVGWIDD